jgi:hypothetical protein
MESLISKMETTMQTGKVYIDKKIWFSMWFLGAVVTFGIAFFPMFYRLIDGRNKHFQQEKEVEKQVAERLEKQGKKPPEKSQSFAEMNAKAWAASIILVVPVFIIVYLLSRDLALHERSEDAFLATAFPQRMFMPQTIPIKTYVLITICTLGVGVVYWLYKVVNLYNAHYKAELQVEKEIGKLTEGENSVGRM